MTELELLTAILHEVQMLRADLNASTPPVVAEAKRRQAPVEFAAKWAEEVRRMQDECGMPARTADAFISGLSTLEEAK